MNYQMLKVIALQKILNTKSNNVICSLICVIPMIL